MRDGGIEFRRRDDAIHEAHLGSAGGGDHLARQQHFHRVLARHIAREGDHGRRAEEADIDAGRREFRFLRGDGEIAARDELAASRGRDAVDAGDDRLRAVDDRLHERRAELHRIREEGAATIIARTSGGEFLQVMTGAEAGAGAREDDGADGGVLAHGLDFGGQGNHQLFGEAVALLRAVKREGRDAVRVLAQEDGVGGGRFSGGLAHGASPGFAFQGA